MTFLVSGVLGTLYFCLDNDNFLFWSRQKGDSSEPNELPLDPPLYIYHCVHPIHANMFSIQMLLHFSQIVLRVCTLVLSLLILLRKGIERILVIIGVSPYSVL